MAVVSQSSYEHRYAKEMKSGMKDKTVSRSVRTLQVLSVVVGLVLAIVAGVQFFVLGTNLNDSISMFALTEQIYDRFKTNALIPGYLRMIRSIAL